MVDVSDPSDPRFATNLFTVGMMDAWETLKVNKARGLLAAVNVMDGQGAAFMGVYDLKDDCRHPKKLFDGAVPTVFNHEGNFSTDGMTYYSGGAFGGHHLGGRPLRSDPARASSPSSSPRRSSTA